MINYIEMVQNVVCEIIDSTQKIPSSANLYEQYDVGSLDVVEIIIKIEEEFNIELDDFDLDLENFETIDRIVALIKVKVEQNGKK